MLKRLFGKSPARGVDPPSFEARAQRFWDWFTNRADTFYQAIEANDFDPFVEEVTTTMAEILPGMAWVFGPGADGVGHSFTISPEGNAYKEILINHLLRKAPDLKGWTFHGSRQPSPTFDTMRMDIAGQSITAEQIWVTAKVDTEYEKIDLICWNPLFENLGESDRGQITFLWLDEALGEFQVNHRIGLIDIEPSALAEAMPLAELPEFVADVERRENWERRTPGEYYTGYKFREPEDFRPTFIRSDIFYGTSLLWQISRDYAKAEGDLEHPLPELGVDYLFVRIPRSELTKGKEVDERAELEDLISGNFSSPSSGICLGGASGTTHSYIDLLVTDGSRGVEAIRRGLSEHRLGRQASLHDFTREKSLLSIS